MTLVEKVARALAVADGCDPDGPAYVRYPGPTYIGVFWRDKYATKARVAIEAMRSPTLEMKQVAQDFTPSLSWEQTDDLLDLLIEAALSERTP